MEEQAPDLAERTLLGGERRPAAAVARHAEQAAAQHAARAVDRASGIGRNHALLVQPESIDLARLDRTLAERAHECARAREQARDERDEQQRRDEHEPPRPVHVEEPGAPVERADQRVVQLVPDHALRRVRPLGNQRPRHRRERQHQQQDQRGAHGAQGSPHHGRGSSQGDAAGGGHGASRGFYGRARTGAGTSGYAVRAAHNPGAKRASGATIRVNSPVTNSTPTTTSSAPDTPAIHA